MSFQETAIKLINEHGTGITLTRNGQTSEPDPVTGKRASSENITYDAFAVPTKGRNRLADAFSGTGNKERSFILDSTTEPEIGDTFSLDSQAYRVINWDAVYHKNVVVYYEIRVTK